MAKRRTPCRSKSCVRARKRRRRQESPQAPSTFSETKKNRTPSLFEEYQKAQGWLADYEQAAFFGTLARPLPVCFRIRQPTVVPPMVLRSRARQPVISNPSIWQFPAVADDGSSSSLVLRQWLATQTRQGTISRQELVSMIPVLLLGIQRHHRILDLCASPGSKTIQAVDALYDDNDGDKDGDDTQSGKTAHHPSGYMVANELDTPRAYVLAHRCKTTLQGRMSSVAIVNHNACKLPNVLAPLQKATQKHLLPPFSNDGSDDKPVDRIICDVPCSGDGTLRKDTKVWYVVFLAYYCFQEGSCQSHTSNAFYLFVCLAGKRGILPTE